MTKPFKPQLRLMFQGSIPVPDTAIAEALYEHLKKLLLETSKESTLNGQIVKSLEPCCKEKPKAEQHHPFGRRP